ncbi:MAG: PqqD family protein [Oscillospiraceae bacterium]|nr:PqqD family protein [Oscillospiraceae bacterium]
MKLKRSVITDYTNGASGMLPDYSFDNIGLKSNCTADFIFSHMKTDTTEKQLASDILNQYDVTAFSATRDAGRIISGLRDAGLLDE